MIRNVTLITLLALCAGVFASDKPAVQARQDMESDVRGESSVILYGSDVEFGVEYDAYLQNQGTRPATQARLNMESDARNQEHVVVSRGEYEIIPARFERTVPASEETRVFEPVSETRSYEPAFRSFNTSSKPAAQARLEMEEGD